MTLPISAFLEAAVSPGHALVFTTFSLDEQVLVQLLREHRTPPEQRIVVFHDVMKHHAPGFLRQHYPDSLVISVQIVQTRAALRSCPVFHSKLWLAVEKRSLRCRVLAAPSLNLRRYHLDRSFKTFETFPWWSNLSLPIHEVNWMSADLLFRLRGHVRRRIPCGTILIDARNGTPMRMPHLRVPAIEPIRMMLAGDEPSGCAAPFVSERAVEKLFPQTIESHGHPLVWMGRRSDGTSLHAKLLETNRYLVLGSTNMTCQALGIGKFLNHETVVVVPRGRLRMTRLLRGFPREDYRHLRAPEEPGDLDEADEAGEDWSERRRLALNGPTEVALVLVDGRPEIRVVGSLAGANRIAIASNREEALPQLVVAAAERLRFPTDALQVQLATHMFAPPVEVHGLRQGKALWKRELDCGAFWAILEANAQRLTELRLALGALRTHRDKRTRGRHLAAFLDVREARREAYLEPKLGHEQRAWQTWLAHLSRDLPVRGTPAWCIDLARGLRAADDA